MFGVAARDVLDVARRGVSHPACMSTSTVVIAREPNDPGGSRARGRPSPEGMGSALLVTDPDAQAPSLARERNRHGATRREADASLVAALLRKEPGAADALYARYASRIYGLGLVLLRDRADAEDLVQDTFLKVWRTGSSFDPQRGSMDVWVLLTARSLAIDLLRRRTLETRKLRSEPSVSDVSDEPGPEWLRGAARPDRARAQRHGPASAAAALRRGARVPRATLIHRGGRAAGHPSWHGEEPHPSGDRDPPRDPRRGRLGTAADRHAQAGRSRSGEWGAGNREARPHQQAEGSAGPFLARGAPPRSA